MDGFDELFRMIENNTGIQVNESHKNYVMNFVQKRIMLNPKKFSSVYEYTLLLKADQAELDLLIDEAAINETYFFREESHFDYLKEKVLPDFVGRPVYFWSAACSSGEEAVSLYTLAKHMGCNPVLYCTDIDSKAMATLQSACWKKNSFRADGGKYQELMAETGTFSADGETWNLYRTEVQNFHTSAFNLITDQTLPFLSQSIDVIFLRNVFIYFSRQNQLIVLRKMYEALKPGGLLFLSVNEIASLDDFEGIPFVKEHDGVVYYLKKLTPAEYEAVQKNEAAKAARPAIERRALGDIKRSSIEHSRSGRNMSGKSAGSLASFAAPQAPLTTFPPATASTTTAPAVAPIAHGALAPALASSPAPALTKHDALSSMAERFLHMVSASRIDEARAIIESHPFPPQALEYKFYLYGRMYNSMGDTAKEQSILNKCVISNPKFWPGWFSLGLLYARTNQKGKLRDAFGKARDLLKVAAGQNKTEYDFIVESFDLSYFINLADNYIRNTGE